MSINRTLYIYNQIKTSRSYYYNADEIIEMNEGNQSILKDNFWILL